MKKSDYCRNIENNSPVTPSVFLLLMALFVTGCASLNSSNPLHRIMAVEKLTDQGMLAKVAMEDKDWDVRKAAVEMLTDQNALAKVALEDEIMGVREAAVKKVTDQNVLAKVAMEDKHWAVREAAVKMLTDQNSLARVALGEDGFTVRKAAVEKLTDQNVLAKVAMGDENWDIREVAVELLTDQNVLAKLAMEYRNWNMRKAAIKKLTDQNVLAKLAMEDKDENARAIAVEMLTDQDRLMGLAKKAKGWGIRRAAFRKLNDKSLDTIAREAKDPAVVIAARIRLKRTSWEKAFDNTDRTSRTLGDLLGAVALVDEPQPTSSTIVKACHDYIRLGDASRVPELCELMLRYGDESLAEDYLNCGKEELEETGREWAKKHGYMIRQGDGSHRVQWGSGR